MIDREALFKYESIDFLERHLGVWELTPRKTFYTNLLQNVRKCSLRSREGFLSLIQMGVWPHPPIYIARIWKTQGFALERRSLIVNESNQTNVTMMEKV